MITFSSRLPLKVVQLISQINQSASIRLTYRCSMKDIVVVSVVCPEVNVQKENVVVCLINSCACLHYYLLFYICIYPPFLLKGSCFLIRHGPEQSFGEVVAFCCEEVKADCWQVQQFITKPEIIESDNWQQHK